MLANDRKEILPFTQFGGSSRCKAWIFEIGSLDLMQFHQVTYSQRAIDNGQIVGRQLQVLQQQIANARRH